MPTPTSWQELTRRNIDTIREIFKESDLSRQDRLLAYDIASRMIRDDRFDTVTSRWNAFHNALRIVVEGLMVSIVLIRTLSVLMI